MTTQVTLEDFISLDGRITSVSISFPLGCNCLVDVAVGHGSRQMLPRGGVISLNNATPVWPTDEACQRNESVWCTINNGDGVWPHLISVIITMEGE